MIHIPRCYADKLPMVSLPARLRVYAVICFGRFVLYLLDMILWNQVFNRRPLIPLGVEGIVRKIRYRLSMSSLLSFLAASILDDVQRKIRPVVMQAQTTFIIELIRDKASM